MKKVKAQQVVVKLWLVFFSCSKHSLDLFHINKNLCVSFWEKSSQRVLNITSPLWRYFIGALIILIIHVDKLSFNCKLDFKPIISSRVRLSNTRLLWCLCFQTGRTCEAVLDCSEYKNRFIDSEDHSNRTISSLTENGFWALDSLNKHLHVSSKHVADVCNKATA